MVDKSDDEIDEPHMVDKSDDEIDEPHTKRHLTTKDMPGEIRYDNYNHWPVLKDIPNSQCGKD